MNEYVCDDRKDIVALGNEINNMTDGEFEAYCEKLKEKEEQVFVTTSYYAGGFLFVKNTTKVEIKVVYCYQNHSTKIVRCIKECIKQGDKKCLQLSGYGMKFYMQ